MTMMAHTTMTRTRRPLSGRAIDIGSILLLLLCNLLISKAFYIHQPLRPLRSHNRLYSSVSKDAKSSSKKNTGKKKYIRKNKTTTSPSLSSQPSADAIQTWRIFDVQVHPDKLQLDVKAERKYDGDCIGEKFVSPPLIQALYNRLRIRNGSSLKNIRVVRRSLDARLGRTRADGLTGPRFVHVVDIDVDTTKKSSPNLKNQPGRYELQTRDTDEAPIENKARNLVGDDTNDEGSALPTKRVIIVGAGPAGLFAALTLASMKSDVRFEPIILERGQPVELRGKDIGALMHRRILDSESNYAFGEGGAGTWSDGKLTTRIGRNSQSVRHVLETLVKYGAPASILVDGSPHLGTDNLVKLLRNMRSDLFEMGGRVDFGCKVTEVLFENKKAVGVRYEQKVRSSVSERNDSVAPPHVDHDTKSHTIYGDAVILASGHSARDIYEQLYAAGVQMEPKGFAVGFRIEHPQKIINKIQYGSQWGPSVVTGKLTTDGSNQKYFDNTKNMKKDDDDDNTKVQHTGILPVPSYRLATDKADDGTRTRGVYSFCMCPGGQIVPASTNPDEICVNGMSFSRRDSQWANSALVVQVFAEDDPVLDEYKDKHGNVMAGLAFQRDMERRAAILGGGNLTVPVQRVTDFLARRVSTSAPSSSYRLGVKPAGCHEIYPEPLYNAICDALVKFDRQQMPGFICEDALLHAVETRTSSPVRIPRDPMTLHSIGIDNLFPAGEGAGFAGGIVSAAVDGMVVAQAVVDTMTGGDDNTETARSRKQQLKAADSFY